MFNISITCVLVKQVDRPHCRKNKRELLTLLSKVVFFFLFVAEARQKKVFHHKITLCKQKRWYNRESFGK